METRWDGGTIFGLVFGFLVIFGSFTLEGGKFGALILLPAMLIVFGGTIAAAMVGTSMKSVRNIFSLILLAARPPKQDVRKTIDTLVFYSNIARREGLFAVEKYVDNAPHQFLQKRRFTTSATGMRRMLRSFKKWAAIRQRWELLAQ
jgi:chemotaxis protein MotA